jgi:hypothetical protein
MKLLSLNCQGCGGLAAVQELHILVEDLGPKVVFLCETKLVEERAQRLGFSLGFPNIQVVRPEGRSGGLALFWRRSVTVMLQSKSKSHIDVTLMIDSLGGGTWRLTGFYGEPRRERRKDSWHLMSFFRTHLNMPWLCAGDFNDILHAIE